MKLAELFQPWIANEIPECEILGLHNDSRQIKQGFLFIAYPGHATDGRLFIAQAIRAGAIALVYEPENWPCAYQLPSELPSIALPGLGNETCRNR